VNRFRPALPSDTPALLALAVATGLFTPEDAQALLGGVLDDLHAGRLGEGHQARVWTDAATGAPEGWSYFAPTPNANRVWDLWWIGVDPRRHGAGVGTSMLRAVEELARAAGGRLLVVETSAAPALAQTRRFYAQRGYTECGRIPDFYDDGDDKVIFARGLARAGDR
jgi:ribosomal protein S18 acetylase RimI-like enzyme